MITILLVDDQKLLREGLRAILDNGDGLTVVAEAAAQEPPVLVLITFDDQDDVVAAIAAGANGYLLKDIDAETSAGQSGRPPPDGRKCHQPCCNR